MTTVEVYKKDETLIQIRCSDSGVIMEIVEFFTFTVEGAKYHPLVRSKQWDGRISLLNKRNQTLPYGLITHLGEFCKSRGYAFAPQSNITNFSAPTQFDLREYVSLLNITTRGSAITPRDYQVDAFQHAVTTRRSVLISPTASGKSLIIYMMLRWFLDHATCDNKRVLIIVPTTALCAQMKGDFADYSQTDNGFNAESAVHEIYAGKAKDNPGSDVYVTTWQSAITMPKEWFCKFGMVIGDEAHGAKAKSLNAIMSYLTHASYRIGTTGTLDNVTVNKLVIIGNFGPIYRVTSTKELMTSDTISQLKICCLVLKYPDEIRKAVCKAEYKDEIDFIISHANRNKFITNLASGLNGNTLILFNYVEKHGKPLYKLICDKVATTPTRKVFYVSGCVDTDERERIRKITESETNAIIVASLGTFSTGTNLRNLHNLMFAAPTKSQIRVLQSIGRVLRKTDDGKPATLYDISDDLSWKKKKNHTLNHAIERIKIYDSEQFDYKLYEVPIT